jgi:hypothetical protein
LEHGAELNVADKDGLNVLHLSSKMPDQDILKHLLYIVEQSEKNESFKVNADKIKVIINDPDNSGQTPLHALLSNETDTDDCFCLSRMLSIGADPSLENGKGETAFRIAVRVNKPKEFETLLEHLGRQYDIGKYGGLDEQDTIQKKFLQNVGAYELLTSDIVFDENAKFVGEGATAEIINIVEGLKYQKYSKTRQRLVEGLIQRNEITSLEELEAETTATRDEEQLSWLQRFNEWRRLPTILEVRSSIKVVAYAGFAYVSGIAVAGSQMKSIGLSYMGLSALEMMLIFPDMIKERDVWKRLKELRSSENSLSLNKNKNRGSFRDFIWTSIGAMGFFGCTALVVLGVEQWGLDPNIVGLSEGLSVFFPIMGHMLTSHYFRHEIKRLDPNGDKMLSLLKEKVRSLNKLIDERNHGKRDDRHNKQDERVYGSVDAIIKEIDDLKEDVETMTKIIKELKIDIDSTENLGGIKSLLEQIKSEINKSEQQNPNIESGLSSPLSTPHSTDSASNSTLVTLHPVITAQGIEAEDNAQQSLTQMLSQTAYILKTQREGWEHTRLELQKCEKEKEVAQRNEQVERTAKEQERQRAVTAEQTAENRRLEVGRVEDARRLDAIRFKVDVNHESEKVERKDVELDEKESKIEAMQEEIYNAQKDLLTQENKNKKLEGKVTSIAEQLQQQKQETELREAKLRAEQSEKSSLQATIARFQDEKERSLREREERKRDSCTQTDSNTR